MKILTIPKSLSSVFYIFFPAQLFNRMHGFAVCVCNVDKKSYFQEFHRIFLDLKINHVIRRFIRTYVWSLEMFALLWLIHDIFLAEHTHVPYQINSLVIGKRTDTRKTKHRRNQFKFIAAIVPAELYRQPGQSLLCPNQTDFPDRATPSKIF